MGKFIDDYQDKFIPEPNSGCWLWVGAMHDFGYGVFKLNQVQRYAHRASFEEAYGTIPPGKQVCHRCDNPACIRPDHLFLGSQADNMADMSRKGRSLSGARNPAAKITEQDVRNIRSSDQTRKEIARKHKISITQVDNIRKRRKWAHVI